MKKKSQSTSFFQNKVTEILFAHLLKKIAFSTDSTKSLIDEISYINLINTGELDRNHKIYSDILLNKNSINVGDFLLLAEKYSLNKSGKVINKTKGDPQSESVMGIIEYSFVLVKLMLNSEKTLKTPKAILGNKMILIASEISDLNEKFFADIKDLYARILTDSFKSDSSSLSNDDKAKLSISQQNISKLFMEIGDLNVLKQVCFFKDDVINVYQFASNTSVIMDMYRDFKSGIELKFTHPYNLTNLKVYGFGLALLEYIDFLKSNHAISIEKAINKKTSRGKLVWTANPNTICKLFYHLQREKIYDSNPVIKSAISTIDKIIESNFEDIKHESVLPKPAAGESKNRSTGSNIKIEVLCDDYLFIDIFNKLGYEYGRDSGSKEPAIDCSSKELIDFIVSNFTTKRGSNFREETLKTYLKGIETNSKCKTNEILENFGLKRLNKRILRKTRKL